jgi:predicted DNA-binding protein YlxM (UPF0122 family)
MKTRHANDVNRFERRPVLEDLSVEEVIEQFDVTRDQVTAVLEFVAQSLRADAVPARARPL